MPPQHGESTLSTVFADLHYVFSAPGQRPVHDRFEKGSYVYIHHNPASGTGRIEVANNAGTPNQDAFDGSLESARLSFSHKRPSQISIAVVPNAPGTQWQLPSLGPGQDKQYMYPIQEIDIYFWTADDAQEFLTAAKKVRRISALNVQDVPVQQQTPAGGPHDSMSPVVQKLEQAAISSPYQSNQRDSASSVGNSNSFPPPPPIASMPEQQAESYKPVAAYNPAAPPPPEPIAHREKTPPPPDAGNGTGLMAAEHAPPSSGPVPYHPNQASYAPQYVQQQPGHHPYASQPQSPFAQSFSPTPSGPTSFGPTQSIHSTHSSTPPQRATSTSSFPPPPPQPHSSGPQSPYGASFAAHPASQQAYQPIGQQASYHQGPISPGLPPPPHSPAFAPPPQSPSFAPPPQAPLTHQPSYHSSHTSISPPPSNQAPQHHHYAHFNYGQSTGPSQLDAQAIHSQVYIPTDAEAGTHGGSSASSGLQTRADKIDKGVGRFLKKLDKKFG